MGAVLQSVEGTCMYIPGPPPGGAGGGGAPAGGGGGPGGTEGGGVERAEEARMKKMYLGTCM